MKTRKCAQKKSSVKLLDCFVRLEKLNIDELVKKTKPQVSALAVRNERPVQIRKNIDHTKLANKLWNAVKKREKTAPPPKIGQIILAKMRTYRPWPAVILNDDKTTVFWVRFLGKGTEGSVPKKECVSFEKTLECIQEYLKAPVDDYARAVREAEIKLGIPFDASLLRYK